MGKFSYNKTEMSDFKNQYMDKSICFWLKKTEEKDITIYLEQGLFNPTTNSMLVVRYRFQTINSKTVLKEVDLANIPLDVWANLTYASVLEANWLTTIFTHKKEEVKV